MTRTWEIDGSKAMPIDLVLEQDFILRLRRVQRLGGPHLVANLVLSAIPAIIKSHAALEAIHANLKEYAKASKGEYAEMSNGDVFFIWSTTGDIHRFTQQLLSILPVEGHQARDASSFMLTYDLPADYTKLRERSNHYVEMVRAAASLSPDAPAGALKSDTAGPLTALSVDQIGKLLEDIDIRTYARTQPIYELSGENSWQAISEEYFISFDDLRRERFPKLDMITPEHLFFALCEIVDQRLLTLMTKGNSAFAGHAMHINLSVASVINKAFAQFTHSVPRDKRGLITFELHRGDIFQDFPRTLNAIEVLHQEGFKVAMDSVTPDMLPYINLNAFSLDRIKINVSGDRVALLKNDVVIKALQQLPADKLIFFRCDSNQAVQHGRELGIKYFQGWRIDDAAGRGKK